MFRSIFGKESASAARQRQVKTLRVYNTDVTEHGADQYQVTFDSGGTQYSLTVYLPTTYPDDRPVLTVSPAICHPWLDANMVVTGAPGIVNYTKHCDLGQLVHNIVHELHKFLGGAAPSPATIGHVHLPPAVFPTSTPSVPQLEPELCPELYSMSSEQLQQLLVDDDRVNELVDRLSITCSLHQQLEDAMNTCHALAEDSMSHEAELSQLQATVSSLHDTLASHTHHFQQRQSFAQELEARSSPPLLVQLLQIGACEADQLSEQLVQQLISGHVTADQFVTDYMRRRTLYHVRRSKMERLSSHLSHSSTQSRDNADMHCSEPS